MEIAIFVRMNILEDLLVSDIRSQRICVDVEGLQKYLFVWSGDGARKVSDLRRSRDYESAE